VGETLDGTVDFGDAVLLKSGTATYVNLDPSGTSRWGDYSATSLDPRDPTRFWTIQMVASGKTTWTTQITEVIAAPSGFPENPPMVELCAPWMPTP